MNLRLCRPFQDTSGKSCEDKDEGGQVLRMKDQGRGMRRRDGVMALGYGGQAGKLFIRSRS